MTLSSKLAALNPAQQQAVSADPGHALVLAGAGSGKTSVITRKIAWLIQECGIPPARIAAVTFTNKAAREMKTRVSALLKGKESKGLTVSTFHTLGLNILRRDGHLLGYKKGFSIFDADDSLSLIRELMKDGSARAKGAAEKIQWTISAWKNALTTPEEAVAQAAGDQTKAGAAFIYTEYTRNLLACNTLDFDDLILQPLRLLQAHPDALTQWQNRIHYLLVDEYQDTNACQYELVKLIVRPRNNMCRRQTITYALTGVRSGSNCGVDRTGFTTNQNGNITAAHELPTDEADFRCLGHSVRRFDGGYQTTRLNHT